MIFLLSYLSFILRIELAMNHYTTIHCLVSRKVQKRLKFCGTHCTNNCNLYIQQVHL